MKLLEKLVLANILCINDYRPYIIFVLLYFLNLPKHDLIRLTFIKLNKKEEDTNQFANGLSNHNSIKLSEINKALPPTLTSQTSLFSKFNETMISEGIFIV